MTGRARHRWTETASATDAGSGLSRFAVAGLVATLALLAGAGPSPAAGSARLADGAVAAPDFGALAVSELAEPESASVEVGRPIVLVGSTMLGAAAADLAGDRLQIRTLIPAQGCPGHFDLTPRALAEASQARLVLVHDYQTVLGERLRGGDPSRDVVALPTSGTQALPEHYLDLCRRMAAVLVERFPEAGDTIGTRLRLLAVRVPDAAARELARARSRVAGRALLVARMQSDFAVWAGARPVALFDAMEDATPRKLDEVVTESRRRRVSGVIGNLQWGDRGARALARELRVPWTLLSNYPEDSTPGAWLRLLRSNVDRLSDLAGDE